MAKPTTEYEWATDATFTPDGDAWGSAANKIDPGATRRAEGAEPDTFPAEWYNYMQNSLGQHIDYIHDVLEGADTATPSGSGVSRSIVFHPRAFDQARNVETIRLHPGTTSFLSSWTNGVSKFSSAADNDKMYLPFELPPGSVILDYHAIVEPGAARGTAADRVSFTLISFGHDYATPAFDNTGASDTTVTDDGTANIQVVSRTSIISTVNALREYYLEVESGNDGGAHNSDTVGGVYIEYIDPYSIGWDIPATAAASSTVPSAVMQLSLNRLLAEGAVVDSIDLLWHPNSTGGTRMTANLVDYTHDWATPTVDTRAVIASVTDNNTAALQVSTMSPAYTVDNESNLILEIQSSSESVEDLFYGCRVNFTDPGPRNF